MEDLCEGPSGGVSGSDGDPVVSRDQRSRLFGGLHHGEAVCEAGTASAKAGDGDSL